MTQQIYPGAWSAALDALRLDPTHTEPPRAEPGVWRQIHAKFTRRGFMRALLGCSAAQDAVTLWIEVIPPGRDAAAFGAEVCAWATAHGAASAAVVAAGPPAELRLEWASGEDGRAMDALTTLLKIGDYLQALEQDASARSPLESLRAAPVTHTTPTTAAPASTFEPIGAATPAAAPATPATPTAFEVIGGPTGAQDSGPLRLTAREITARGARVSARLTCSRAVSDGEQARLRDGLLRALRLRFDVEPRSVEATGELVQVELDALGDGATGDLVSRLGAYLARLIELNALGLTLEEALGGHGSAQRPAAHVVAPRQAPATPAAPQARGGEEAVVLDLGGGGGNAGAPSFQGEHAPTTHGREGALRPKDFMDPRLKRADATTPLVDVVLRHPGYAERATAQAIGILLSVEHHRAQGLVESAPCVIAWGVGREQAQTLKTVVEGAGGKVLLVEPGTFGQR